jgi:hypothetical protein
MRGDNKIIGYKIIVALCLGSAIMSSAACVKPVADYQADFHTEVLKFHRAVMEHFSTLEEAGLGSEAASYEKNKSFYIKTVSVEMATLRVMARSGWKRVSEDILDALGESLRDLEKAHKDNRLDEKYLRNKRIAMQDYFSKLLSVELIEKKASDGNS